MVKMVKKKHNPDCVPWPFQHLASVPWDLKTNVENLCSTTCARYSQPVSSRSKDWTACPENIFCIIYSKLMPVFGAGRSYESSWHSRSQPILILVFTSHKLTGQRCNPEAERAVKEHVTEPVRKSRFRNKIFFCCCVTWTRAKAGIAECRKHYFIES